MSYQSFEALYEGIETQLDANVSLTITLSGNVITYVPIYADEKKAYLATIQQDVQNYLIATLDFADKNASSQAAYWNEMKSYDTTSMNTQTGQIDNLIENFKSQAQMDETDLQTAIAMQEPMNGYLKSLVNFIAQGLG